MKIYIKKNIIKLWRISLLIPLSNAEIERVFSSLKYIKNPYRNRLTVEHTEKLLYFYIVIINKFLKRIPSKISEALAYK